MTTLRAPRPQVPPPARVGRLGLLGALAAVLLLLGLATPAGAAETPAPVTWAVTPVEEGGERRAWVEQELDPGASRSDRFSVQNYSEQEVTFDLTAADGYFTRTGRFNMLNADQESVGAGTWITVQESVTVGPGESQIIEFSTTVPDDAEPGDHAAGIAASITSEQAAEDGTALGVTSRVGFRVMTRVTGEVTAAAAINGLETAYETQWNPAEPGGVRVSFDVENTGNIRVVATGTVEVAGHTVAYPAEDAAIQELLPGETRSFTMTVPRAWPLVYVPGTVTVTPTVPENAPSAGAAAAVSEDFTVWALPLPQLLVLLGVALILGALLWNRGRSRRRLAAMLDEARAEGRATADVRGTTAPGPPEP